MTFHTVIAHEDRLVYQHRNFIQFKYVEAKDENGEIPRKKFFWTRRTVEAPQFNERYTHYRASQPLTCNSLAYWEIMLLKQEVPDERYILYWGFGPNQKPVSAAAKSVIEHHQL